MCPSMMSLSTLNVARLFCLILEMDGEQVNTFLRSSNWNRIGLVLPKRCIYQLISTAN